MQVQHCPKCGHTHSHSDHHCQCVCCKHHISSRFLYDDDFRLRLGGLQGGLNYRLRQLIGCQVDIRIENYQVVRGEISHVGSNFVELIRKNHTMIFSLEKINHFRHYSDCQGPCKSK